MRRRFADWGRGGGLGLCVFDQLRQTGDLARSGFAVINAFFSRLVDGGLRQLQLGRRLGFVFALGRDAHGLDDAFDVGSDGAVAQAPSFILQSTFFRRFMIGQDGLSL